MGSETVWDELDMGVVSAELKELFPEYAFDGKKILEFLMQGRIWEAVKEAGGGVAGAIESQSGEIRVLFITVIVLGITAAIFSNFADMFQNHQVSDIAFYFIYLLFIAVLLKGFASAFGIVQEVLENITMFMKLFIPTYMIAVGSASGIVSAGAYYQLLMVLVYLIEWGFLSILLPCVSIFVLLSVINGIWMEEKLTLLLELIEKVIGGCIKITIGIVTGFSILQAMISPVLDSLQSSALKKAMSAIPGIGGLTEGMFEMVIGSAVLIKNSIGLYITLLLIMLCAVPLIKLALLSGALKLGAALVGIVSDKRMTNCANRVGNGNLMLLKVTLASVGLFIIQIAIIAYSTNRGI